MWELVYFSYLKAYAWSMKIPFIMESSSWYSMNSGSLSMSSGAM